MSNRLNNLKLSLNNNNDDDDNDDDNDDDDEDDEDDDDDVLIIISENTDLRLFRATTSPSNRRILLYFKHSLFSSSISDV